MTCDCCGSTSWVPLFSQNGVRLGTCPECDLHYVDAMPSTDARMTEMEEGHYAGSLEVLDADRQFEVERKLADSRFSVFVDLAAQYGARGHWLDIGCGAGILLSQAAAHGFTGEGIELNHDRRAIAAKVTGMPMHGLPVEELKFPDASFDVVSMINVFSHLTSPTATLTEIKRILKPGGLLVMATGEITAGAQRSHMLNWNLGDHLYFLGDRTIDRYAEKVGYQMVHHKRAWLPDEMFSREWLAAKGRSRKKNAVKTAVRVTPGGLKAFRAVMLRVQKDSAAHSGVFVLRPTTPQAR